MCVSASQVEINSNLLFLLASVLTLLPPSPLHLETRLLVNIVAIKQILLEEVVGKRKQLVLITTMCQVLYTMILYSCPHFHKGKPIIIPTEQLRGMEKHALGNTSRSSEDLNPGSFHTYSFCLGDRLISASDACQLSCH